MLTGILVAAGLLVFAVSHLVTFYLMGKAFTELEAQRDAYKQAALLAINDATETQSTLQEVLEAVFEATEARPMKAAKPIKELD